MQEPKTIFHEVKKAVVGKDQVLLWGLAAILAKGHILLEDVPGVGKTTLALAFSRALGLKYSRVQFTPDVLPSDVTGYSIYDKTTGTMAYQPGAVLCNLFLADELNRATSRTQSALLEAMEEGQVTVDGVSHPIPKPFTVIATQNPTGAAGTQLLPDSEMDRFTIRLSMGYPDAADEREMVLSRQRVNPLDTIQRVMSARELEAMQEEVAQVYVAGEVVDFVVQLMNATRSWPGIARGGSPRATLSVTSMAKAMAYLKGRDYVIPGDVQTVFREVVAHRLVLTSDAEAKGTRAYDLLDEILKKNPAPKLK